MLKKIKIFFSKFNKKFTSPVTKIKVTKDDIISSFKSKSDRVWLTRILGCHDYVNFCFYNGILFAVECIDEKTFENGEKSILHSVTEVEGIVGTDNFPWMYTESKTESNKLINDVLKCYKNSMDRFFVSYKVATFDFLDGKINNKLFLNLK